MGKCEGSGAGTSLTTLTLAESLDLTAAGPLLEEAKAAIACGGPVVVDCRRPSFLPTPVAQVLLAMVRAGHERDVPVSIMGIGEAAATSLGRAALLAPLGL